MKNINWYLITKTFIILLMLFFGIILFENIMELFDIHWWSRFWDFIEIDLGNENDINRDGHIVLGFIGMTFSLILNYILEIFEKIKKAN